jgi:hypothetical protein
MTYSALHFQRSYSAVLGHRQNCRKREALSVKKNKPRVKKTSHKGKRTADTLPSSQPPLEPQRQQNRVDSAQWRRALKAALAIRRRGRLWRAAKWGIAVVVAVIGLIASIVGIWGLPWPTKPAFAPGLPSLGSSLDVPFSVTNKSAFFSLNNLQILCGIISIQTSLGPHGFKDFSVTVNGTNELKPLETRSYTCPFNQVFKLSSDTKISEAQIQFASSYDRRYPKEENDKVQSEIFILNTKTIPPQWTIGVPMK